MKAIFLLGLSLLKTGDNSLQRIIIPIISLCYSKHIAIVPINCYNAENWREINVYYSKTSS